MSDYKQTIFLPQTTFAMKANLREREAHILKYWQDQDVYIRLQEKHKDREKFLLQVGPPYANGHIHVGHAFNFILKDIVIRIQQLCGKKTPMVPGWDCHGLPIEWKIEEAYRAKGQSKEKIPATEFRAECRRFATQWIDIQREEFKRLGLLWDWDNPYITMDFETEADTVETLYKFLDNGALFKGVKPVLWSVVEKTALAEAEVEYKDKTSSFIYVRFPLQQSPCEALIGTSVVIWTTTPWTLPGNRAVAYGPEISYGLYRVDEISEDSMAILGESLLISTLLIESFADTVGIKKFTLLQKVTAADLENSQAHHPLYSQGYDFVVPLIAGHHVTTEAGTGFVHTAPGHGLEDFEVCKHYQIEVPETVAEDGCYYPHVPIFAGHHIFKVDELLINALHQIGMLVKTGKLLHSYPHSWRSKAPLIYRTTPQWFISMEKTGLRNTALRAIEGVQWFPKQAQNRIRGMIETRPDWCISRQRAWGVPLALFVDKRTGQPLNDPQVNHRVLAAMRKEGADAWFTSPPERFLNGDHDSQNFEQVHDILDVWFDSGTLQYSVLEKRSELSLPASLYLEGSDQHRGWFQSSLLIGCGTRGHAPYESVLTHGFVLDEHGHKMSKSVGNVVAPEKVISTLGAEILRLWVIGSDFTEDLRIGPSILKHQEDIYRRYRNTLKYLLGALSDFQEEECLSPEDMPELEQWILHRLALLQEAFIQSSQNYELQSFYAKVHTFCVTDLSAFYFDIRKDILYCDARQSLRRRATRTVMDYIFKMLVHWLSPVLCFTTEEAWHARYGTDCESLQFSSLPEVPNTWLNLALGEKFELVRHQRRVMTGALEHARTQGLIGSSLQAAMNVYDPQKRLIYDSILSELAIVSKVVILQEEIPESAYRLADVPGLGVVIQNAVGEKCLRCWRVLEEVSMSPEKDICQRCEEALESGSSFTKEN